MADDQTIAGLGTRAEYVAPSPRFDPAKVKLKPDEQVVLAAVGQVRQIGELLASTGLGDTRTIVALLTLKAKGVLVKAAAPVAPPPPPPAPPKRPVRDVGPAMAEKVDLDDALKARLLELEELLETADHFALLGVAPDSDPATVKKVFFKLSHQLHPDRYFRKNLGTFRPRLDKVFRALSKAHQTLTDPRKREAYLVTHPELRPRPAAPPVASPPAAPASTEFAPPGAPTSWGAVPAPPASAPTEFAPPGAPTSWGAIPAPSASVPTPWAPAPPAYDPWAPAPPADEGPAPAYTFPSTPMFDAAAFEDPASPPAPPAPPAPAPPAPRLGSGQRLAWNMNDLKVPPAPPDGKGEKK